MTPKYLPKTREKAKVIKFTLIKTLRPVYPGGPKPALCQVGDGYTVVYPKK